MALPLVSHEFMAGVSSEPSRGRQGIGSVAGVGAAAVGVGGAAIIMGAAYGVYRVVRFIPSLFPPLWPTIVPNLVVP